MAGFLLASNAKRLRGKENDTQPSVAAGPQSARLGWKETYGAPGEQIVFTVDTLTVTDAGWNAHVVTGER